MNWQNIIQEIAAHGMTQAEIGKEVGLSQPSIADLAAGRQKDVRYTVGVALVALHKRVLLQASKKAAA